MANGTERRTRRINAAGEEETFIERDVRKRIDASAPQSARDTMVNLTGGSFNRDAWSTRFKPRSSTAGAQQIGAAASQVGSAFASALTGMPIPQGPNITPDRERIVNTVDRILAKRNIERDGFMKVGEDPIADYNAGKTIAPLAGPNITPSASLSAPALASAMPKGPRTPDQYLQAAVSNSEQWLDGAGDSRPAPSYLAPATSGTAFRSKKYGGGGQIISGEDYRTKLRRIAGTSTF